jgi:hypothetical protein
MTTHHPFPVPQLTSTTLSALATAVADEHCVATQLVLSFNPQLPPAQEAARALLAAMLADPPAHRSVTGNPHAFDDH